jgi:hypothetical protein
MQIFEASLDGPVLQSQITGVWSKWFRVTLSLSPNRESDLPNKNIFFAILKFL